MLVARLLGGALAGDGDFFVEAIRENQKGSELRQTGVGNGDQLQDFFRLRSSPRSTSAPASCRLRRPSPWPDSAALAGSARRE